MMKKLSLYWKTWLITVFTILVTLGVFFALLSFSLTYFIESSQKKKFNQNVDQIAQIIESSGIDEKQLDPFFLQGYTPFITKNGKLLYPEWGGTNLTENNVEYRYEIEGNPALLESAEMQVDSSLVTLEEEAINPLLSNRTVIYKGESYDLSVFAQVAVGKEDMTIIFFSIAPYFLIIGLIVSFAISVIYARYFSSKITRLNTKIDAMAIGEIPIEYQPETGDEIQDLENNLHKMYAELQNTLEQLSQEMIFVKRLEKDRQVFMRGATHELKTPIMVMSTMLEGMMEKVEGFENHEEYLKACYIRLQSMGKLVNEMLEVSRIESIKYTGETDLNEATNEMLEVYQYMIDDKHLELSTENSQQNTISIPKRTLQKVLSNLIGNAVKYTPENGAIKIYGNQTSWTIENQISGTAQVDKGKIFEPFITFEKQGDNLFEQGHGLGLYIVDAILKQYAISYDCEIDQDNHMFKFTINDLFD